MVYGKHHPGQRAFAAAARRRVASTSFPPRATAAAQDINRILREFQAHIHTFKHTLMLYVCIFVISVRPAHFNDLRIYGGRLGTHLVARV